MTETRPTTDAEAPIDAEALDEPASAAPRNRVLVPLHAVVAAVLTWPLAANLTDSLPYGTENNPTVQLFNLWTLRWNQNRIGHLFANYWDAPIFHPTGGAFALSEPQPLTGLVFAPISWLSGNPVLAVNVVLLAILTANGWAAARLARHLGAAPGPAVLVGVLAQAAPFVATQMGVLQLTVLFPLFLLIDAIVRWAPADSDGHRRRTAAEIGLWLGVTFLTCGYYGLFAVVGIGAPALILARRQWLSRARLVDAAAALGVFAVLALPAVLSQASITSDYERSTETVRDLSASGSDFWRLPTQAHGGDVLPWVGSTSGRALYPGTALLVLGVVGFVIAYRRFHPPEDRRDETDQNDETDASIDLQRLVLFLVVAACLARALSLGLHLSFGPYRLVRAVVPGFESLRSPFRFAVLTEVFLAALAAFSLDALWRWRPRRDPGRPWGAVAAVALVVVGVLEVGIMPVRLFEVDQSTPDWAAWLDDNADERPVAGDGSIAFLPFPPTGSVVDYEPTVRHMLQALDFGGATVNGYSGFFPQTYDDLENAARSYPNDATDALLRQYGVSFLVVDKDWLDPTIQSWLDGRYQRMFGGEDAIVYELAN